MFNQLRSDISTLAAAEFQKPVNSIGIEAFTEISCISPVLQRRSAKSVQVASRKIRHTARVHVKPSRKLSHSGNKYVKTHRHKASGRTRRA